MNVRFTDGRTVAVVDADCEFRPCFTYGLDRGPYVQGRGYTNPTGHVTTAVCNTRHLHGCPHVAAHPCCHSCHSVIGEPVPDNEDRVLPDACPKCGSSDGLYWLSDVLHDPTPCCDEPDVPTPRRGTTPYRQTCRNCGARLRGRRLELAR